MPSSLLELPSPVFQPSRLTPSDELVLKVCTLPSLLISASKKTLHVIVVTPGMVRPLMSLSESVFPVFNLA